MITYLLNGQSLASLGISSASLKYSNQTADELSFSIGKSDVGEAGAFAWGSAVSLSADGVTIFSGHLSSTPVTAVAKGSAHNYVASGPWWQMERLPYSQPTNSFEGSTVSRLHPAVKLGRNQGGNRVDTMAMLDDMIRYAGQHGVNIALGNKIRGELVPEWGTQSRMVAEIIRQIMAWHPDSIMWFSYAGGVPRLNVGKRSTMPQVVIDADAGRPVSGLDSIVRRDDMTPENVIISWETTQNEIIDDVDPVTNINYPEEESRFRLYAESYPNSTVKPGTLFFTLPATAVSANSPGGASPWKVNNHVQPIEARRIPEEGDNDRTAREWWLDHSPLQEFAKWINTDDIALPEKDVDDIQAHRIEFVVDKGLTPIAPATNPNSKPLSKPKDPVLEDYPNELVSGSITDWMRTKKHIRDLPLIASVSLALKESAWNKFPEVLRKRIGLIRTRKESFGKVNYLVFDLKVRIIATNARTKVYKAIASIESGDPAAPGDVNGKYDPAKDPLVVLGLARTVYESRHPAQWQGRIELVESEVQNNYIGSTLNVRKSGRPEWLRMKAMVQGESFDLFSGNRSLTLGPAGQLSPQNFITLMQPARDMQRASNEAAGMGSLSGGGASSAGNKNAVFGAQQSAVRDVQVVTPSNARKLQLEIRAAGEGKVKIYYGEVFGMGFDKVIEDTDEREWKEFSTDITFLLKISFTPESRPVILTDNEGAFKTVYFIDDGGSEAEVKLITIPFDSDIPDNIDPKVNTVDGEVLIKGVYYVPIGHANNEEVFNSIYGPLNIGFCAPGSIRFAEVVNTEIPAPAAT